MIEIDDTWFSANDDNNGLPVKLRGRNKLGPLVGLSSHPNLVRIIWKYEPAGPHGLPSSEESHRMDIFEDVIFDALEAEPLCIFYCVYLHNGCKEWLGYCSDVDMAEEIINDALLSHETYPIELSVSADPDWSDYKELLKGTGQG